MYTNITLTDRQMMILINSLNTSIVDTKYRVVHLLEQNCPATGRRLDHLLETKQEYEEMSNILKTLFYGLEEEDELF